MIRTLTSMFKKIRKKEIAAVNYQPDVDSHFIANLYVDNAIDEISLLGKNQNDDFNNFI